MEPMGSLKKLVFGICVGFQQWGTHSTIVEPGVFELWMILMLFEYFNYFSTQDAWDNAWTNVE